jgi:uncharacterized protein (TIGR03437 family)
MPKRAALAKRVESARSKQALAARQAARIETKAGSSFAAAQSYGQISPGTSLSRVLHTSQLDTISTAGSDEQYVDVNFDLVADQRRTFDAQGGSFDIAVGKSGARYEVYSAIDDRGTPSPTDDRRTGVLLVANDSNGDFVRDSFASFDLGRDWNLPSAAAVASGEDRAGHEFVIVSSSGFYNFADPNDPDNEPSAGVVLLVRDPVRGGFDGSLSRVLVRVGSNQLNNANGLALLPNNDLLIADSSSHELRIVRDTNQDGLPDTLDSSPYYSYQFSDDGPLDVAVNSRGVLFSHGYGSNTVMLAIYDTNGDGRGDHEEVAAEGLSLDNRLIFHGLAVDREGTVYVIEDAAGAADSVQEGGNGGVPQIDAFPDPGLNGILRDGAVFASVDQSASQALSGLAFGADPNLGPVGHLTITNSASRTGNATSDGLATISGPNLTFGATGATEEDAARAGVYVTVEGQTARVLSFNNSQLNISVPKNVSAGPATVVVFNFSDVIAADDISIAGANPGIFAAPQSGTGSAIALLASALRYTAGPFDSKTNGQPSVVVIYGTGWRNALPLAASIGGKSATVQYAGPAGDFPGLDEVVVEIPSGISGNAAVLVTDSAGHSSQSGVVIGIK